MGQGEYEMGGTSTGLFRKEALLHYFRPTEVHYDAVCKCKCRGRPKFLGRGWVVSVESEKGGR